MSKTTSFVVALGAFGALAYLLNPLPPQAPSANRVATAGQDAVSPGTAVTQPAAATETSAATVARPPPQDATVRLVQQIQTELLRLGCYAGAVDGRWTLETQQAMHILGERVRVLRPVETPDYIMLALARSQASHICTARDRATAAARLPARVVPTAAPLEKGQRPPGSTQTRRSADRSRVAGDTPYARVARQDENRSTRTASDREDDRTVLAPRDDDALGENRMGLGAAPVDPLRAGIDPRDPTAPAVLRGPSPPTRGAALAELTPPPSARRTEREWRSPARPRRDWKRNVFIQLRESGP